MTETKKHYNEHRKGKKSFQIMLPEDEYSLVERIKKLREFSNNHELLITLCREEKERLK